MNGIVTLYRSIIASITGMLHGNAFPNVCPFILTVTTASAMPLRCLQLLSVSKHNCLHAEAPAHQSLHLHCFRLATRPRPRLRHWLPPKPLANSCCRHLRTRRWWSAGQFRLRLRRLPGWQARQHWLRFRRFGTFVLLLLLLLTA